MPYVVDEHVYLNGIGQLIYKTAAALLSVFCPLAESVIAVEKATLRLCIVRVGRRCWVTRGVNPDPIVVCSRRRVPMADDDLARRQFASR